LIVGLCGNPTAGKSTVQEILQRRLGVVPVDDGWPLRDFAIRHLGATIEDVTTQPGKARTVTLPGGRTMTWRKFLGEFGNRIEDLLGPDAIPEITINQLQPGGCYSLGSVRRDQGRVVKHRGGVVIGIAASWAPPSEHEFDRFDHELVDAWITSETRDLAALERQVIDVVTPYLS
jgi:hypothetical protein